MTVEENREIARRFVEEVWGHGDEDVAREIVDRNVVHHRQRAQETFGIAGLYEGLRLYETAYPQRTFEQTDVVVEGKFVQDRWVMSAVHSGDMLGVPPTGRQVTLNGQNRYLIENGRIVEIWHDEDIYGMMRQIGWEPSLPDGGSQDAWPPRRATRYGLPGPQVEPEAGVWAVPPCPLPSVIRVEDVLARTDDPDDPWYFPPYPDYAGTQAELAELAELVAQRDDPTALAGGVGPLRRQGPSPFLLLRPAPVTAVYDLSRTDPTRMVNTGRDLARWFENETPGLSHRQAATFLLNAAGWSPPRHTLVWAALDVAIHSAVLACWHYKWASERTRVAWRPRPVEVDYHVDVLYNRAVDLSGLEGQARSTPRPSPGTPRHPSYPSGHASVG
ncbi:MAG TPA: ester cyclase, partial [Micromonosporaceae bacterium]|nr:ester cyclase [Micromonosporaceae bacterium]